MSDTDASGSDDFSGLTSFFFYVFLVHPVTGWILRPGRFERSKSIWYAITFLAVLASIKTGLEWHDRGPNYYIQLGVTRASNPLEIKRAYKRLSLQLHPDKNPSATASDEFEAVKQAYDVLMDMELREVYNKFGAAGIAANKRYSETQFLLELAVFYVSYGMLAFLLTMGKRNNGDARNWTFTGLMSMMVIEVMLMTAQENPVPAWLFPQLTEYEIVWLLRSLFPAFMNGCRSLGSFLYVDMDEQTRQLLLALQEQNKDVLLVLRDIQIGVQTLQQHGVSTGNRSTADAPVLRPTPTGRLRELQTRLQKSNGQMQQAVGTLQPKSNNNGNMGFYLMILGYIAISYAFNS